MNVYFDSHCHLNDEALYPKRKEIVEEALKNGVRTLLVVGYDVPSSLKAVEIAREFEGCYAAIGFQPENLSDAKDEDLDLFRELAEESPCNRGNRIGLPLVQGSEGPP